MNENVRRELKIFFAQQSFQFCHYFLFEIKKK